VFSSDGLFTDDLESQPAVAQQIVIPCCNGRNVALKCFHSLNQATVQVKGRGAARHPTDFGSFYLTPNYKRPEETDNAQR
jgi:hypothetical protein